MESEEFYTAKSDRCFKEIFLKEENKDLLKLLLEIILTIKIDEVIINNIELVTGNVNVKGKRLDALLKVDNKYIGIEVNSNKNYDRVRNTAYLCNTYASYTTVGNEYNEDIEIVQIDLTYGMKWDEEKRIYTIKDENDNVYVKNFKIIELNMDKFQEKCYDETEGKYLKMLNLKGKELEDLADKDEKVARYMEELEKVNSNLIFREFMSEERDRELRYNTGMHKAQKQGALEKTKQAARNFHKNGADKKLICDSLEISEEELEEYLKEN